LQSLAPPSNFIIWVELSLRKKGLCKLFGLDLKCWMFREATVDLKLLGILGVFTMGFNTTKSDPI